MQYPTPWTLQNFEWKGVQNTSGMVIQGPLAWDMKADC